MIKVFLIFILLLLCSCDYLNFFNKKQNIYTVSKLDPSNEKLAFTSTKNLNQNTKKWVYVFQKAINHPYSGNSEDDFSYNCVVQNLYSDDIYNKDALIELRAEIENKALFIVEYKEEKDFFYVIKDISKTYGDKYIYAEGILYADSKEKCLLMKIKVKILTQNYVIKEAANKK